MELQLLILCLAAPVINAAGPLSGFGNTCKCHEHDNHTVGHCNLPDGEQSCEDYCRGILSNYQSSYCEPRGGDLRECVCISSTVSASCAGDPLYVNFDGTEFTYPGTCKHLLVKASAVVGLCPLYQIYLQNREWNGTDAAITAPDFVELIIDAWNLRIVLGNDLVVNGDVQQAPYMFQRPNGFHLDYVTVELRDGFVGAFGELRVLTLTTSFGLTIVREGSSTPNNALSVTAGVYIFFPTSHPCFSRNTLGLFGVYDNDVTNDFITQAGQILQPTVALDAWAWGDSWCLDKNECTSRRVKAKSTKVHALRVAACKENPVKRARINVLCAQIPLLGCLGESREQAWDDCFNDCCFASLTEEKIAACNTIQAYANLNCLNFLPLINVCL